MLKKYCAFFLLLALLASCPFALSENVFPKEYRVYNCNSYITLRESDSTKSAEILKLPLGAGVVAFEEAENGFLYVNYRGETGYALQKYLEEVPMPVGTKVEISESLRYDMNLFLSNFTESDLTYSSRGVFDLQDTDENILVDFALEHTWFNYASSRIEWGEYANANNVRMKDDHVLEIIDKYFGVTVNSLSPRYADYNPPYYYWCETGGHMPGGFALTDEVTSIGAGRYLVTFSVFGAGDNWDNGDLSLTKEEARSRFPYSYESNGYAIVYASNLLDRSTYKLTRMISY